MNVNQTRRALIVATGTGLGLCATRTGFLDNQTGNLEFNALLSTLIKSMTDVQRLYTLKSAQHPARQITNTVAVHKGPHIGTLFSVQQRSLINDIYRAMLSSDGLRMFHNTVHLEGKLSAANLTIYQDLSTAHGQRQVQINGGHFMLRKGNEPQSGYAFGGPIAYGQQIGNGRFMVEGNAFKPHGDAMHNFHRLLTKQERATAYFTTPPSELDIQPLAEPDLIPGLKIGSTSEQARNAAHALIDTIFQAYNKEQRDQAWLALNKHGGLDSIHVSMFTDFGFYRSGPRPMKSRSGVEDTLPYIQVWRLEGPNSVIHFQGYPHIHAYINIIDDPEKKNIGERLTYNTKALQGPGVQNLWQAALREYTELPFAFYSAKPNGRLPRGEVSTGSVYAIEPFDNHLVTVDVNVSNLSTVARASLLNQGADLHAGKAIRLATYDYMVSATNEFGKSDNVIDRVIEHGPSLRSIMIDHLRKSPPISS